MVWIALDHSGSFWIILDHFGSSYEGFDFFFTTASGTATIEVTGLAGGSRKRFELTTCFAPHFEEFSLVALKF